MVLQCKESNDFKPHPEGIHPAVCVDVIDLGLVETDFQGQKKLVNKVKVVFESEQKSEDGKNCTVSKNFTASLHPKAKLADFLGKWRGRPVVPGDQLVMEMKVTRRKATVAKMYGQARVNGVVVAEAEVMCKLDDKEPEPPVAPVEPGAVAG